MVSILIVILAVGLWGCQGETVKPLSETPASVVASLADQLTEVVHPEPEEMDVPLEEPVRPLEHRLSRSGRLHNSNCRYWKTAVSPPDPKQQKGKCKFCGG